MLGNDCISNSISNNNNKGNNHKSVVIIIIMDIDIKMEQLYKGIDNRFKLECWWDYLSLPSTMIRVKCQFL